MNVFDLLRNNSCLVSIESGTGQYLVEDDTALAVLIAASYKKVHKKYLLVCPNLYKAQRLYSALVSFIDSEKVVLFPTDEIIRNESVQEGKELVSQRLFALSSIVDNRSDIVITNVSSTLRYLPSKKTFIDNVVNLKVGDRIDLTDLKKRLVFLGYSNVLKIDQSLQFAVRGDILDIFSINNSQPIRIEFFDDEIESIRYFDIASQVSVSSINEVKILPASDILFQYKEIKEGIDKIRKVFLNDSKGLNQSSFDLFSERVDRDIEYISNRNYTERVYKYCSLVYSKIFTIFDYCDSFCTVFCSPKRIENEIDLLYRETEGFYLDLVSSKNIISSLKLFVPFSKKIDKNNSIVINESSEDYEGEYFDVKPINSMAFKEDDIVNIIKDYLDKSFKVLICLPSFEQYNLVQECLEKTNIHYQKINYFSLPESASVGICLTNLIQGFTLNEAKVAILTSKELFNTKNHSTRLTSRFKNATILRSYEDLSSGDFVVHEFQGIGRFEQLVTLMIDNKHKDFLKLIYANEEILYVPLEQFQLVRKYMGQEGRQPRLSRLHSKDWENTKKRIKDRINDLADRLLSLYRERSKVKGFAFQKDDEIQKDFESKFLFPLTSDQARSVEEIKADMEKDIPMDRLLCGDVGFGKTEVAFRAAFKAILSGKQVCILCPTTLLARQHYETAIKRFMGYDVNIAIFSRLIPESMQKAYKKGIFEGKIHLIIGTHKLLNKEIVYKDLGLLIIDEEQRFGVEQKERLKELRQNIDVLTITATPIPRTLQISMLGLRGLSMINTAPQDRYPVQTYVLPKSNELIKELIQRELARDGQVFFLHNNISSLFETGARIQKMVPDAKIGVAHGKMDRNEVEDIMIGFYSGEINILVSTSIIENGIDVPNANMIIVEDADKFGLSQLYQIKGRVGRSDQIAYSYLMYNADKQLNENAQKRLKAIKDFTALGSGYKIAQRDLMIRGAGDILGPDQAGFIDCIGLDMYIKLLNETIKEKISEVLEEEMIDFSHNLDIDAYVPDSYANETQKIEIYQNIKDSKTIESLNMAKSKIRDIYGRLPAPVELLFKQQAIDIYTSTSFIEDFKILPKAICFSLGEKYTSIKGIGNILFEKLVNFMQVINVSYSDRKFKFRLSKNGFWVDTLEKILSTLSSIIRK